MIGSGHAYDFHDTQNQNQGIRTRMCEPKKENRARRNQDSKWNLLIALQLEITDFGGHHAAAVLLVTQIQTEPAAVDTQPTSCLVRSLSVFPHQSSCLKS